MPILKSDATLFKTRKYPKMMDESNEEGKEESKEQSLGIGYALSQIEFKDAVFEVQQNQSKNENISSQKVVQRELYNIVKDYKTNLFNFQTNNYPKNLDPKLESTFSKVQ